MNLVLFYVLFFLPWCLLSSFFNIGLSNAPILGAKCKPGIPALAQSYPNSILELDLFEIETLI